MTKILRLFLLLFMFTLPAYAQTGPGALRPPPTTTLLSAVTTDTNSSPLSVRDFGAVNLDVAISGGTVVITVKARINTAATFRAIGGYSDADGSTVSTITATGSYTFTTAGKEDIEVFTTSTSGATTTVIARPIPSVGKAVRSGGGSTSLAIGTTAITGGTSGRVLKNNAGTVGEYPVAGSGANVPLIDGTLVVASGKTATVNDNITLASDGTGTRTLNVGAGGTLGSNAFTSTSYMPLAGGTFTGDVTHSGAAIIISGNISTAAWTTSGVRIKGTPGTLTDTTSSGTVATAYTDVLGGNTIAASSATTFTNYFTQYNKDPIAGTNVTLTNKWALGGDSLKVGTSSPLTVSNAGVLNATSPVFVTPTLGVAAATSFSTDVSPQSTTQNLGSATLPWNSAFIGNTTQYESVSQSAGLITHAALGSAAAIEVDIVAKGSSAIKMRNGGNLQSRNVADSGYAGFDAANISSFNGTARPAIIFATDNRIALSSIATITWNSSSTDGVGAGDSAFSRISAGLIGVGTGSTGSFAGSLKMTDLTAVGANVIFSGLGSDATHTDVTVCADSTTGLLYKGSGTLGICLGTSSARFKNSIHNLNEGLNQILALRPVSYFYDSAHGDGGQRIQYGFTAEDTKSVLPALVGLDKAGQPNSVDMLGMLPVAIKAIQELKDEVDALKAEIQSLKQQRHIAFYLPSVIGL